MLQNTDGNPEVVDISFPMMYKKYGVHLVCCKSAWQKAGLQQNFNSC